MTPLAPVPLRDDLDPPPEYLRQGPHPVPAPPETAAGRKWGGAGIVVSLVTLTAFGGGVWFAYQRGVQEGQALSVPLIKADTSPTGVVPVEPGGMIVANQDKRVFDTMATAVPVPRVEQLLPPPETPMAPPAAEPRVVAPLTPLTPVPPAPIAAATVTPIPEAPVAAPAPRAEAPNGVPVPPRAALPDGAPADGRPLALVPPAATAAAAPRPAPNPAATAAVTPPAATAPAAAAAGGYRIQLGAYGDAKSAMDNWSVLVKRYGTILAGMTPTVVVAQVQGKTYHRLQAGPVGTSAAATDLCARVKAAGAPDCLVVKP